MISLPLLQRFCIASILAATLLAGCEKKSAPKQWTPPPETPPPETPRPARRFPDAAWQITHPSSTSAQSAPDSSKPSGTIFVEVGETKVELTWTFSDHQDGKDIYRVTRLVSSPANRQEDNLKVPYAGEKVTFFKDDFGACEVLPQSQAAKKAPDQ